MGSITLFLTMTFVVATLHIAQGDEEASKPNVCPRNEVWSCAGKCPGERTCADRNKVFNCAESRDPCQRMKCKCQYGYYRYGKNCISREECDKEYPRGRCPSDEEYVRCLSCPPDTCEAMSAEHARKCKPKPPCKPGCQCRTGYKRLNKKCVQQRMCPRPRSD